jgi:hypothetical protein
MFAEEHELLKGSIFVLECKPPNTVHSAIRCIGHSPELEVENKKTSSRLFSLQAEIQARPTFCLRGPSTLVPLPT